MRPASDTPRVTGAWLPRAAAARPDRVAVEAADGAATYTRLLGAATDAARSLAARGVRPGDRVALALPGGLAFATALHGCLALGAVAAPVDPRDPGRALPALDAATVVDDPLPVPPAGGGKKPELWRAPDPDAPAVVVGTSGSSGAPKPIELTHGNLAWSALASAAVLGLDPAERWLAPMPVHHVGGLSVLVRSAIAATTAIVHAGFDAGRVHAALRAGEATVVSLVPTMLARLLDRGLRHPPRLRCALVGGGPIPPGLLERAADAGVPVAATYGLTEACSQVATTPPGTLATAAVPLPGVRVAIAPDGEILVAGPTVAPGAAGEDGWLRTGDLGELDAAGRLTVTGRRREIIVTGGENVVPAEVEHVLEQHPAVAEAAVVGRADPEWGEAVVALVVAAPGAGVDAALLRAHCAARLPGFKVPKAFLAVTALPRTASGKLARARLGDLARSSA